VEAEEAPLTVTVTVLGVAQVAEMGAMMLVWEVKAETDAEVEPGT